MRNRPAERLGAWMGQKQILCLMAGLFIGLAAQLWQHTDSALLEGDTLVRGSYGQGDQTYSLIVEGLGRRRFLWKWSCQKGCIQNRRHIRLMRL